MKDKIICNIVDILFGILIIVFIKYYVDLHWMIEGVIYLFGAGVLIYNSLFNLFLLKIKSKKS